MVRKDNIIYGPELHMPIPDKSLGKVIYECVQKGGETPAFIDEVTKEQLTYNEFQKITCRLAQCIKNCGYKQEDVLGICSENNIYFFCPIIAAIYLGISIVPISQYYGEDELQHVINVTKPKVVFCSEYTADVFLDLKKTNHFIERIIMIGVKEALPGTVTLEEFLETYSETDVVEAGEFQPLEVNAKDHTALILFSSGTTGLPKGVMITHRNCLMRIVHTFDERMHFKSISGTVCLGYLPFYHASGLFSVFSILTVSKPTIVMPRFEERMFLECIQKYKISAIAVVPTLLVMLAKSPTVDEYDISCLEEIIIGAAPVSESLEKEAKAKLGVKSIRQVYGMTELTLAVISIPEGVQKQGSSGVVAPGMVAVVRDPETGKFLGPNQVGEICMKGDMIMKGYYGNPKATADTFTENGWLKTGDLGYYDKEEYFYIVDRLKELIKYKSFQVPPAEIEGLLLKNPKIKEAAVVGLPDERAGELPLAFVVKQTDEEITEDEIIKYVAKHLSKQKQLHGGVRFLNELPKNMSGKILRRELKEMLKTPKSKL